MTYEEFKEKAEEALRNCDTYHDSDIGKMPLQNMDKGEDFVFTSMYLGGMSGGSCWDEGEAHLYFESSGDTFKDFWGLDSILLALSPQITFMEYKTIQGHIIHGNTTEGEYYGNTSEYAHKGISLQTLYDTLQGFGYV